MIDAADDLAAKLNALDDELSQLRPLVRRITLKGVTQFAADTDAQRRHFVELLTRTATIDAMLICGLIGTLVVLYRQIQISRRAADEMQRGKDRYAKTINASLDAIIVTDPGGTILDFNPAAAEMFGFRPEDAIGKPVVELIIPPRFRPAHLGGVESFMSAEVGKLIGKGRLRTKAMRSDRHEFPVELSLAAVSGDTGPIIVAFVRDISKQIAAERALESARDEALAASEAKSRFVAVMSHEMRTPLNGVVGILDLLRGSALSPAQSKLVETAMTSAEILNQHVDDVLDTSRIHANRMDLAPSAFDFTQLANDVLGVTAAAAKARGNRVAFDAPPDLPKFYADRKRLQQVVINLVANAIKFTSDGRITIRAEVVHADAGAATLEVSVSDTGIGIPEEHLDRIFEDFVTLDAGYRRAAQGTGLGLPICRNIVRMMGGDIGVESRVGHGSRFWFRVSLPVANVSETAERRASPALAQNGQTKSLKVLVVEDIETNRMVVKHMLEDHGCEVTLAVDGEDGVGCAEREVFDVILMDISMPGVDGVEATRRVRNSPSAQSRAAPIFALTAHALPHEHEAFLRAGMQGCLVKPIRSHKIESLLASLPREPLSLIGEA